jgi:hypothetical protein
MFVETSVLGSHKRMNQMGREIGIRNTNAVFAIEIPCAHHLSVRRIDLSGESVDGILQILDGRHITYPSEPYSDESDGCQKNHRAKSAP